MLLIVFHDWFLPSIVSRKKKKLHSLDNNVICMGGGQAIKKRNRNELEISQVIKAESF